MDDVDAFCRVMGVMDDDVDACWVMGVMRVMKSEGLWSTVKCLCSNKCSEMVDARVRCVR